MFSCQGLCPNQRFLSKFTMYANYLKYFKIMKMIMKILSCQGLCPNQRFLSMKIDYICDQCDHFVNSGYVWTNFPYFSQAWVTKTHCLVKGSTPECASGVSRLTGFWLGVTGYFIAGQDNYIWPNS